MKNIRKIVSYKSRFTRYISNFIELVQLKWPSEEWRTEMSKKKSWKISSKAQKFEEKKLENVLEIGCKRCIRKYPARLVKDATIRRLKDKIFNILS